MTGKAGHPKVTAGHKEGFPSEFRPKSPLQ